MLPSLLRRTVLAAGFAAATLATSTVASAQNGFWAQVQVGSPTLSLNGGGFVSSGKFTMLAGNVSNGAATGLQITIDKFFCTDNNNNISLPATYVAYISYLSPTANLTQTRLGSSSLEPGVTALSVYTQNAGLANSINTAGGNSAANNAAQAGMWANVNTAAAGGAAYTNNGSAYSTFNTNGWFVVTAPPGAGQFGGTQELLAYSSSIQTITSVPEPGTYALLVPALFAVGMIARRRRSATLAS